MKKSCFKIGVQADGRKFFLIKFLRPVLMLGLMFSFFSATREAQALPPYYEMTVHNNFGPGEYYGVTPSNSTIWLVTDFAFDYKDTSGNWTTGNAAPGTYGTSVALSQISSDPGSIRLLPQTGGTRMYAALSSTAPTSSTVANNPNSYFEWSFPVGGGNTTTVGSLDLSWIDSYDFSTRMKVTTTGTQYPGNQGQTIFGGGSQQSSLQISNALAAYVTDPKYTWLGTTNGGFSQTLTYNGTTSTPVRWITKNHDATVDASTITSFTNDLTRIGTQTSTSPVWAQGTPGTGPNWTTKGFRVASLQPLLPPDGTILSSNSTASMWSAYVNFSGTGGNQTMTLTDFTIWGTASGTPATPYTSLWTGNGTSYSLNQSNNSVLNAIWTSSANGVTNAPSWFTNLGGNSDNLFYAIFNGIVSGVPFSGKFLNNDPLPSWPGYVAWTSNQTNYNFEILTHGAQVGNSAEFPQGLAGYYSGDDLVSIMEAENGAGYLVSPYFLELLKNMEQTSAYLHPSQDFWGYQSVGNSTFIGIQPTPLNGDAVFGNATLDWYIGTNAIPEPRLLLPLAIGLTALMVWRRRRRVNAGAQS